MPNDYERALVELYGLSSRGVQPGLARVREILARTRRPERDLPAVHVAGTNGKGSVARMVATGIEGRVGLFTSPHLHRLTERFAVLGGEPVEEAEVARAWGELRRVLDAPGAPPLTFFEAVTVMAFTIFAARSVDVAVLEVGLGGRLDSTNVIERPLACAITRVGLDHQRFLGDDLRGVAREKAGILKPGVPAVIGPQRPEAMEVIEEEAARVGAPLVRVGHELSMSGEGSELDLRLTSGERHIEGLRPALRGAHQRDNAAVAVGLSWLLQGRGVSADPARAVGAVQWPGRLEWVRRDGEPPVLLDAAHNVDGCEALVAYLAEAAPRPRALVFGAMMDKDWPAMLETLRPGFDSILYTKPALARGERPEVLARHLPGRVAPSVGEALSQAGELARGGTVVVAGSLFVMADARAYLLGLSTDPPIAL